MCEYCLNSPCPAGCPGAPPEAVYCRCCQCGEDILMWDDYYDFHGDRICLDCLESWAQPFTRVAGYG